jgi:diguanylate cyclase (GGDEF)-like protein
MSRRIALPTLASRIRATLLGVAFAALAVSGLGAMVIGHLTLHRQTVAHVSAVVLITAAQSQASLLFRDPEAAMDVLRAIPAEEGIRLAEIRDTGGAALARLERPEEGLPAWLERLLAVPPVSHPVTVDGRIVGSVVLEAGARPLVESLAIFLIFDLLGVILTALVVLTVARRITRNIASPLTALGEVMREVHADGDHARRAPAFAVAEIDSLGMEFNALLDEIERREREVQRTHAALRRLALRDPLTGLANRAMFESALLAALGRDDRAGIGLLYFDLDAFKAVNDTFGHAAGDLLLRAIAARLDAHAPEGAVTARLGGDEFVVLLPEIGERARLDALAATVQAALHAPVSVGPHVIHPGVSVGAALSGENADASQLIDLADRAMYAAKAARRDAGRRTRWETAAEAAQPEPAPQRRRDPPPLRILGERNAHTRTA